MLMWFQGAARRSAKHPETRAVYFEGVNTLYRAFQRGLGESKGSPCLVRC